MFPMNAIWRGEPILYSWIPLGSPHLFHRQIEERTKLPPHDDLSTRTTGVAIRMVLSIENS
jgi:hypothetical protein